ncbi:MAG: hypothetical protein K8I30_04510, partial [Anaerolineae bacterium]|nr:hypothetical protein [Anaerolineae bacterium]
MKVRLLGLLCAALFTFGMSLAAAQDQTTLDCLGLSESDCAIVQKAAANLSNIESLTYNFTFSAGISNASNIVQGIDGSITAQGSGTFAHNPAQADPASPYSSINLALDLSGTVTGSDGEQSGAAHLVIADGNIYLQDDSGAWRGTVLSDLAQHPDAQSFSFMSLPVMQLGAGMAMMSSGQGGSLTVEGMDVMALLQAPGFLNQARLGDETLDGQNTAVFSHTADIGALMTNPAVQGAIAGMGDSTTGSEDPMAQQMAMMLPILLENTTGTVTLTRWIGTDDH